MLSHVLYHEPSVRHLLEKCAPPCRVLPSPGRNITYSIVLILDLERVRTHWSSQPSPSGCGSAGVLWDATQLHSPGSENSRVRRVELKGQQPCEASTLSTPLVWV
jgi:hypothetical protein